MNRCGKCGVEAKENVKFCKACGSALSKTGGILQDKKARVVGTEKSWRTPVVIAAAIIIAVGAVWALKGVFLKQSMEARASFAPVRDASARLSKATPIKSEGGDIRIPLAAVGDGNAHFFAYEAGGKTITFFVMKAVDGSIRTAYDACMACNHAKLGYRQEGSQVVCNNCGMGFKPADIGNKGGGCNPIPISRTLDGSVLIVKANDIEKGSQYF